VAVTPSSEFSKKNINDKESFHPGRSGIVVVHEVIKVDLDFLNGFVYPFFLTATLLNSF
jgi:hypothetical protein